MLASAKRCGCKMLCHRLHACAALSCPIKHVRIIISSARMGLPVIHPARTEHFMYSFVIIFHSQNSTITKSAAAHQVAAADVQLTVLQGLCVLKQAAYGARYDAAVI